MGTPGSAVTALLGVRTEHGKGGAGTHRDHQSPAPSCPSSRGDRARACAGVPDRRRGGSCKQGGAKRLISIHLPAPNLPPADLMPHHLLAPPNLLPAGWWRVRAGAAGRAPHHAPHGTGATGRLPRRGEPGQRSYMVGETWLCPHLGFKLPVLLQQREGASQGTHPATIPPCLHPARHEHLLPLEPLPMARWQGMGLSPGAHGGRNCHRDSPGTGEARRRSA